MSHRENGHRPKDKPFHLRLGQPEFPHLFGRSLRVPQTNPHSEIGGTRYAEPFRHRDQLLYRRKQAHKGLFPPPLLHLLQPWILPLTIHAQEKESLCARPYFLECICERLFVLRRLIFHHYRYQNGE